MYTFLFFCEFPLNKYQINNKCVCIILALGSIQEKYNNTIYLPSYTERKLALNLCYYQSEYKLTNSTNALQQSKNRQLFQIQLLTYIEKTILLLIYQLINCLIKTLTHALQQSKNITCTCIHIN
jgi:hypothetical protein